MRFNEYYMKDETKLFKALANERRLMILNHLTAISPLTVGVIAKRIKLSFKSTSRHLQVLYSAGIVSREQVNLEMRYYPNRDNKFWAKPVNQIIRPK